MTEKNKAKPVTATQVLQFLTDNPDFLATLAQKNPAFGNTGNTGNKVIDLTPAIAKRAHNEVRRIGLQNKSILTLAAENMVNWQRLHHAALALLAADSPHHLFHVITAQFPLIFDLAACHLVTASPEVYALAKVDDGMTTDQDMPILCTPEKFKAFTNGSALTLGLPSDAVTAILDSPPASVAIIALPDKLADPVAATVLVLCGRTPTSFTPDLANDLLVLLAEMLGVALTAHLERMEMNA